MNVKHLLTAAEIVSRSKCWGGVEAYGTEHAHSQSPNKGCVPQGNVLFYYICSVFMASTYAIAGGIIWRVSG